MDGYFSEASPIARPTASAVDLLSPVTITTLIPACLSSGNGAELSGMVEVFLKGKWQAAPRVEGLVLVAASEGGGGASLQVLIAAATSGRGGSLSPTTPTKVSPVSI